jgi:hypothetical protein
MCACIPLIKRPSIAKLQPSDEDHFLPKDHFSPFSIRNRSDFLVLSAVSEYAPPVEFATPSFCCLFHFHL